jgi:branched-subunit amino acid ABC-type transport system permease component
MPNLEDFKANFGGYVLGLIVVLLAYSAVEMAAPQYADMFALITLLGVVLWHINHPSPQLQQP